ncbi:hypothetical protein ACOACO_03540 [Nocardioides sp. CPCC 205120]|uniref:hypothetical protein n=1 Tax=Nocardioides sp. CPCC 205120 TaxID=3406462 RepID=UPI003B50ADE2
MQRSTRRAIRSNAVSAAGVLAVVAAGYGVWQVLGGPDPQVISAGDAVAGDFTCAEASSTRADFPDGLLPEGAIAARLCTYGHIDSETYSVPLDALTAGTADLVGMVNGARRVGDGDRACNDDAGPRWTMALQYPDGSVRSLAGDEGGCEDVALGDVEVQGIAAAVVDLFVDRLAAQRRDATPPPDVPDDSVACDALDAGGAVMPWSDPSRLTSATLCWATTPGGPFASVPLTPEQTEVMLADLSANLRDTPLRAGGYACPSWTQVRITGRDLWGEPVTVWSDCRDFYVDQQLWVPSAPTLELLLELSGQRLLPPPTP